MGQGKLARIGYHHTTHVRPIENYSAGNNAGAHVMGRVHEQDARSCSRNMSTNLAEVPKMRCGELVYSWLIHRIMSQSIQTSFGNSLRVLS